MARWAGLQLARWPWLAAARSLSGASFVVVHSLAQPPSHPLSLPPSLSPIKMDRLAVRSSLFFLLSPIHTRSGSSRDTDRRPFVEGGERREADGRALASPRLLPPLGAFGSALLSSAQPRAQVRLGSHRRCRCCCCFSLRSAPPPPRRELQTTALPARHPFPPSCLSLLLSFFAPPSDVPPPFPSPPAPTPALTPSPSRPLPGRTDFLTPLLLSRCAPSYPPSERAPARPPACSPSRPSARLAYPLARPFASPAHSPARSPSLPPRPLVLPPARLASPPTVARRAALPDHPLRPEILRDPGQEPRPQRARVRGQGARGHQR